MDISVVVPTHNRRDWLPRALASVRAQTCPPREIIVVDDGSDDGTVSMLEQRFPDVCCLRQSHRGVSSARNLGIRRATGEWVALLDSDDEWLPRKLERQQEWLCRHPGIRLCHTDEVWIQNGKRRNPGRRHRKQGGWIYRHCLILCCISPSSVVVHRSVFHTVGMFDESLPACEDYDMWLRVCSRMPVGFIDEQLVVKHGGHPDQLSRRHWGMDRFRVRALEKMLAAGGLAAEDARTTRATLEQRLQILEAGARKRGRTRSSRLYRGMLDRLKMPAAA